MINKNFAWDTSDKTKPKPASEVFDKAPVLPPAPPNPQGLKAKRQTIYTRLAEMGLPLMQNGEVNRRYVREMLIEYSDFANEIYIREIKRNQEKAKRRESNKKPKQKT